MDLLKPLPRNAQAYTESLIERCEALIESDIWSGIQRQRLDEWLSNFEGERERFLAARVLDSLIYRSSQQTDALIMQLVQRALPDLTRSETYTGLEVEHLGELLSAESDSDICVVPVVTGDDSPTKSGPAVCRQLKRLLRIEDRWIRYANQITADARWRGRTIVFVDDFLGTGLQFKKFFRKSGFENLLPETTFIYAPLVAHQRGIEHLQRVFPFLFLTWAERLDHTYNLFASESAGRGDHEFSDFDLRQVYNDFLKRKQLNIVPRRILGYARLGLCFAFQHGTPNATLPILWINRSSYWPLFTR